MSCSYFLYLLLRVASVFEIRSCSNLVRNKNERKRGNSIRRKEKEKWKFAGLFSVLVRFSVCVFVCVPVCVCESCVISKSGGHLTHTSTFPPSATHTHTSSSTSHSLSVSSSPPPLVPSSGEYPWFPCTYETH